ncbi:hypothetical protein ACJX0J_004327 [Zea mays]
MLTNRLRKIGSDFASLGFRNSVMEKEVFRINFHIDLGHIRVPNRISLERRSFSPYETFNVLVNYGQYQLIVLWQLYSSLLLFFYQTYRDQITELFPLYESILFQFLPETSQEKSRIGSKIDGINIYILLVQEEDCTMREAQSLSTEEFVHFMFRGLKKRRGNR